MKNKCIALAAVAALLLYTLIGGALAAVPEALETQVSVSFVEKIYFYDFPDGGGMDVDFGEQRLPPLGYAAYLPTSDGDHTLRVCDRRTAAGGWKVDAIITLMTSGDESFTGYLNFYNPTTTTDITPNLIEAVPNQCVHIKQTLRTVMTAAADLTQGDYELKSTAENTRLAIPIIDVANLKPLSYKATVTWTLTLTP